MMNIEDRAREISEFLMVPYNAAFERLSMGFHFNHAKVAEDFKSKNVDVNDGDALLNWYRTSDAYIWELSAYHLEPGFNYVGMCNGITSGFSARGKTDVLALGDGIGDLSIVMHDGGLNVTYHDLANSLTSNFAQKLFAGRQISKNLTENWEPNLGSRKYTAVVALDFFEHLVNVEQWVEAVYKSLKKGGVFLAQNAFAIGDAEHGDSIPMHLSINNRFENDWGPLLNTIGFKLEEASGWWIKE